MDTNLGKVLTYDDKFPSLKSHDPSISQSTSQFSKFQKFIFSTSQDLWAVNLASC